MAIGVAIAGTASAAPAEQADCPYDAMTEQHRTAAGEVLFAQMNREKASPLPPAQEAQAQIAIEKAMAHCIETNAWTQDQAAAAFSYATTRMLSDIARRYVQHLGGETDAADLFYAQNKYAILDEDAAGNSSKEWANTRLVEMGFAKAGSPAFDAIWLYLGLLFQRDAERDAFVTGQKPEGTK